MVEDDVVLYCTVVETTRMLSAGSSAVLVLVCCIVDRIGAARVWPMLLLHTVDTFHQQDLGKLARCGTFLFTLLSSLSSRKLISNSVFCISPLLPSLPSQIPTSSGQFSILGTLLS